MGYIAGVTAPKTALWDMVQLFLGEMQALLEEKFAAFERAEANAMVTGIGFYHAAST